MINLISVQCLVQNTLQYITIYTCIIIMSYD